MKITSLVAAALALTAATRIAAADPGTGTDPDTDPAPQIKDPNTALMLSLGGTAVSWGLLLAGGASGNEGVATMGLVGTFVAPSFGHWYSDQIVTGGMAVRAASTVAVFVGAAQAIGASLSCEDSSETCNGDKGGTLIALGLIGYAGGTIYDIATAPSAAREYNEKHRVHLTMSPTVLRPPSGPVMGFGIGGSF